MHLLKIRCCRAVQTMPRYILPVNCCIGEFGFKQQSAIWEEAYWNCNHFENTPMLTSSSEKIALQKKLTGQLIIVLYYSLLR